MEYAALKEKRAEVSELTQVRRYIDAGIRYRQQGITQTMQKKHEQEI